MAIKSIFNTGSVGRGVFYDDVREGLVLDGDALWDSEITGLIDDLSSDKNILTQGSDQLITESGNTPSSQAEADLVAGNVGAIDFTGTRVSTGEYELTQVIDFGGKFEVELEGIINNSPFYISDFFDDRSAFIDTWSDLDGTEAEETNATLFFRASDDALTEDKLELEEDSSFLLLEDGANFQQELSVVFSEFRILRRATFVGRTFQFKLELETDDPDQSPVIDELSVSASVSSRTERSDLIDSGAGAKVVSFANAFHSAPTVVIAAFNLTSGEYYETTSVTRTGFTVHFKDSSNLSVDRKFEYAATGFGLEET